LRVTRPADQPISRVGIGYFANMRKVVILIAGTLGFILGSRAGREPYDRLTSTLAKVRRRPEVRGVVDSVRDQVEQRSGELSSDVQSKLASSSDIGAA
jgi:hypothetical protein